MKNNHFSPQKSLGQNFLIDRHVQEKIIAACCLNLDETVLEIGPGKGALTKYLAKSVSRVIAVERDTRLVEELKNVLAQDSVEIIHKDILDFALDSLPPKTKIIGNLPYNIATPIIERVIQHRNIFQEFYFMVQREHGERIIAKPHNKDYGSFSCFVQYYADVKKLFNIKPSAFSPVPKVQSCFLYMRLREPHTQARDESFLFRIIQTAFQQRRKNILNSLSTFVEKEALGLLLEGLKIDSQSRAENLTLENYIQISDNLNAGHPNL